MDTYLNPGPTASEVEAMPGPTVLEFGTPWCGFCRAAQAPIGAALAGRPDVRHLKVEDGSGRPLGRAFRVKLWPTLIFLRDGKEVARLVRPQQADAIRAALAQATAAA
ncbi:thioredoxin family protein [Caenimonas terrae]|uniref:Thioredoxin family protein n=1 Tax=Caenimonas terrae TaxID=696074 RepID=A0ABW0NCN8_9BURK